MRVLVDITHPGHVHFFRNAIGELTARGHEVAVTSRRKDVTLPLLDEYGIAHQCLTAAGTGRAGLAGEMLLRDWKLWRLCRRFRPDVLTAISGVFAAHAGWLARRPVVVWDDTEHQSLSHRLTYPFCTAMLSPDCYRKRLGGRHRLYAGCHELAYVHPSRFTPDAARVRLAGLDPQEPYAIVRLVSWGAHHDVGQHGIGADRRMELIQAIAGHARPLITSEAPLPAELEPYRLRAPASELHHILSFARLYVGEGATVAAEAALLGVPTVYVNTLTLGYIDMLEACGLLRQTTDAGEAIGICRELLSDPACSAHARAALDRLLQRKLDATDFVVRTLEAYGQGTPPPDGLPPASDPAAPGLPDRPVHVSGT